MEYGVVLADGVTYIQAVVDDGTSSDAVLDQMPPGASIIAVRPSERHVLEGGQWTAQPESLDEARGRKRAEIDTIADAMMAIGAPYAGYHVAVDASSRANLTAIAATALAAISGAMEWPGPYAQGWITSENVRVPLPSPQDGLTLANSAGEFYASLVQHKRTLKDAVLAAVTVAEVDAVDVEGGW